MNPLIRNILAVVAGWLGGSIVNMSLINLGHKFLPIEGVDPTDMAALAEAMPGFDAKHFIFPFLAHAIGTFVGANITAFIAVKYKMKLAYAIGGLFLIGGIMVHYMLPGPIWFTALDIIVAYIPMAWLGGKLALQYSKNA